MAGMDAPARFPRDLDDRDAFDDWAVYADTLQDDGDARKRRLGELIARDLALPAGAERADVDAFHALHRAAVGWSDPRCIVGYALGHPRTIELPPAGHRVKLGRLTPSGSASHALARTAAILDSPDGHRVESVAMAYVPNENVKLWKDVLSKLPPGCRLELHFVTELPARDADWILRAIAPGVEELVIHGPLPSADETALRFLDDRFAVVHLAREMVLPAVVEAALARTTRTRLRVSCMIGELPWAWTLGAPGDAAIAGDRGGVHSGVAVPRWSLAQLQLRRGPLAIRAQLARELVESYELEPPFRVSAPGSDLARRGDRWTLRGRFDHPHALSIRGAALAPGELAAIAPGERFAVHDREWRLIADAQSWRGL